MSRILFDPETIDGLAAILESRGLSEIELKEGEIALRLVRSPAPVFAAPAAAPLAVAAAPAAPAPAQPPAPAPAGEAPPPAGAVTSPMVGIAYLAPEPGAAPFVSLGQAVTAGQTLLLIEAMKTFNQIKATAAGTVREILVAPGQPVEYGQPLVVIG